MESTCPICKFPLHPNTLSMYNILTFFKKCTFDFAVDDITPINIKLDPKSKQLPIDIIEYIANQKCDMKTRARFPSLCKTFKKHMKPNIPSIHNGTFAWTQDLCVKMPTKLIDVKITDWGEYTINKKTIRPDDIKYLKKMFYIGDKEDDNPDILNIRSNDKVMHKCCALNNKKDAFKLWKRQLLKYIPQKRSQYFKYMLMILNIIGVKVSKDTESILDKDGKEIDIGEMGKNRLDTIAFMQFTPATYDIELQRIKQMYGYDTDDTKVWLQKLVNTDVQMVIDKNPDIKTLDHWTIHDRIFKDITFLSYIPIFEYFRNFNISDESCKLLKYLFNGPPRDIAGGNKLYHLYFKYKQK